MLESQDRVQLEVEEVVVVIGMNPTDVLLMMILMIGMFHCGQIVCFVSHEIFVLCRLQGIINMNKNGNSANFFSCVCNGKKIKELFASTLNGISSSVKCVSSMIVVLNAKFARLFATHANKKDGGKPRSPTRVPSFAS